MNILWHHWIEYVRVSQTDNHLTDILLVRVLSCTNTTSRLDENAISFIDDD